MQDEPYNPVQRAIGLGSAAVLLAEDFRSSCADVAKRIERAEADAVAASSLLCHAIGELRAIIEEGEE